MHYTRQQDVRPVTLWYHVGSQRPAFISEDDRMLPEKWLGRGAPDLWLSLAELRHRAISEKATRVWGKTRYGRSALRY